MQPRRPGEALKTSVVRRGVRPRRLSLTERRARDGPAAPDDRTDPAPLDAGRTQQAGDAPRARRRQNLAQPATRCRGTPSDAAAPAWPGNHRGPDTARPNPGLGPGAGVGSPAGARDTVRHESLSDVIDATTAEQLRDLGSLKWAKPATGQIGAWVAEMDFGTAPAVVAALERELARSQLRLPAALDVRRTRGSRGGVAPGSVRVGRCPRGHPPVAGRDQGPRSVDHPLLPAGHEGDLANPGLHALLFGAPIPRP